MKLYKNGNDFPAIIVIDDGNKYIILDGVHRLEASLNLNVLLKAYIGNVK